MSKNNKFYVKKIKKDNITVAEEKNYKSPFIIFLLTNGRLIFIITLLLSITILIISTSLVFRNMLGSTDKSDKNNTNTTTDNSNVVVTVDISDECNLNNTTPITEEYATKLFDSSRQINTANTGVVIKVKEKSLEDRIIIFYSDKTALIKYKDGTYLRVFRVNNNYGVKEDGTLNTKAETRKLTAKEIINKDLGIKLLYLSDGSLEVTKGDVCFFVRDSDITSSVDKFYTNLSIVSLPTKKESNKIYYSNGTIKENDYLLVDNKQIKSTETKKIHDNITIIYYENGFAEIIQDKQSIIVEKSEHIIYDNNILEIIDNTKEEKVNTDNLIDIKNINLKNNNKKEVNYLILIEETSNYNKYNVSKRLPNEYIKYLVSINNKKQDIALLNNNIKGTNKTKGLKLTNNAYQIYEGKLPKSGEANIKIGMWVDYKTITNEYMNSAFIGTVKVYIE